MNKRIDWIDVAKGIGVVCIIFGHISFYLERTLLQIFVYGFSVFIFFIISGVNFSNKLNKPFYEVFKGIVKHLIIPYIICVIIVVAFKYIYYQGNYDFEKIVFNYVTQVRYRSLWFVPVLAFSQVITWILYQLIENDKARSVVVITLYILSVVINGYLDFHILWNFDCVAYGVFYMYIGLILKDRIKSFDKKWYINISISVILMAVSCISTYINYVTNSSYDYISFTNIHIIPLSIISALCGTFSVILIAKTIHKCKFLLYLGRNSFAFIALNIETIALLLDETKLNSLFLPNGKILGTIYYMALMLIGLSILNIVYKELYKVAIAGCRKLTSYNT